MKIRNNLKMVVHLSGIAWLSPANINRLVVVCSFFCLATLAQAQATRTWVSGVGDDVNPCSRTAPCKSFAGAISKTAASGEISVLDPGGFGAVTVTKAMTIDGVGTLAGITAAGTPAITISAGATDSVTLRNLCLDGAGTGTFGVRVVTAGEVHLENCVIFGFTSHGVDFEPTSTNTTLFLKNCHIQTSGGTGVYIKPTGAGCSAVIESSQLEQCAVGLHADTNATTVIRKSVCSQNTGAGIEVATGGVVTVEDSEVSLNGQGINSAGLATISGVSVTGNTGFGLTNVVGGSILTYHNNRISGNSPDGNPTGSLPLR